MQFRHSRPALTLGSLALLAACSGGGGNSTPTVTPTSAATPVTVATGTAPTTTSTTAPVTNQSAYVCPTSDTPASALVGSASARTRVHAVRKNQSAGSVPGVLAVVYTTKAATGSALTAGATRLGAGSAVRELAYASSGTTTRFVPVGSANATQLAAALRATPGVLSVSTVAARYPTRVTTPYYPNDPYFNGFSTTVATGSATPPPSTYHVAPYDESSDVPGQWNLHAIGLEYAFGYSQPNNGSSITNAAALGSSAVKIAIIDTGEDTNQSELSSKIVYQRCFITNASGTSTSDFTTDGDGHGTDVSGIAAADTGNAHGFTGAGGNVSIMAYRVYPTPDDNCASDTTTDGQCTANTADIASAIDDAVANGAKVISLSLGGGGDTGGCATAGVDNDPTERAAIANAISNNVVVVAAAGNSASDSSYEAGELSAPACDSGVIAVGATGLGDGSPTGNGMTVGTASSPVEYVASYSQYGSPGASVHSSGAWGIVAPGGDPTEAEATATSASSIDDLHWIEDIWTTTPYMANASDTSFEGECTPDYPGNVQTDQQSSCRVLIAGTSMATPEVAGAAALIISANASYAAPAMMKQLLCSTADDIGDAKEGCGRLNVYRAMATALDDPSLP